MAKVATCWREKGKIGCNMLQPTAVLKRCVFASFVLHSVAFGFRWPLATWLHRQCDSRAATELCGARCLQNSVELHDSGVLYPFSRSALVAKFQLSDA